MHDSPFSLLIGFRSVVLRAARAPLKAIHLILKTGRLGGLKNRAPLLRKILDSPLHLNCTDSTSYNYKVLQHTSSEATIKFKHED